MDLVDHTPELDAEIAEARAAMARLQAMADAGNPVAKLAVQRLEAAKTAVLRKFANSIFREA
jgi:predicted TIM-barrel fold metal-dependent hydrolase